MPQESESEIIEMGVSGDIDTPSIDDSSPSTFSSSLSNLFKFPSGIRVPTASTSEWVTKRRQNLKPWMSFISTSNFSMPPNPKRWTSRVIKNVEYFQSNYMFVFLGLIIYCIVTSPMLLFAVAALLGGCYLVYNKNAESKLKISGREIPLVHQYMVAILLSLPIFYIAGATGVLFWVIGASFVVILLHASFYNINKIIGSEEEPFDLPMEQV